MNIGVSDHQAKWYAVRTKPKEEDRADINLRSWQVQTFTPKLKELRASGYGTRYVSKPLFGRYIFAHFDATTQLHQINYTRGVENVVSFGGHPISINDEVIDLIREQVEDDGFVCMVDELKPGDQVRVNSGPLQSVIGVFERKLKDKDRVRILLNAMNYQSHLLIDREMVEKVY